MFVACNNMYHKVPDNPKSIFSNSLLVLVCFSLISKVFLTAAWNTTQNLSLPTLFPKHSISNLKVSCGASMMCT